MFNTPEKNEEPSFMNFGINKKIGFDFSTFNIKKEKTLTEQIAEFNEKYHLNTHDETLVYRANQNHWLGNTFSLQNLSSIDVSTSYPSVKEKTAAEILVENMKNFLWPSSYESPIHNANQSHWLGGRNSFATSNAWSIDANAHYSPVLTPLFIREDSYIASNNLGNDIYNDTCRRVEFKRIEFERSNVGIADYENNIYKRDMITIGRLSDTPMKSAMPSLPSISFKSINF